MKLFDFQETLVTGAIDFFNHGGRSIVLQSPTGTGKSCMFKAFTDRMINSSGRPVYFLTHSKMLMRQFSEHLTAIGLKHGIIAPGYPVLRYRAQVISVQSLASRYHLLEEPEFLIFEECHHAAAPMFKKVLDYWPHAKLLGGSATPARPDGQPLSMFEKMLTAPQVKWFIEQGYLADFDYFIPQDLDTSGMHHKMGDFDKSDLKKLRISSFVEVYRKHGQGKSGIAFGIDIEDSERIAAMFSEAGHPMQALHSKMEDDINVILRKAAGATGTLLSSCEIIGEGIDVKGLSVEIDGRPTESLVVKRQHSGRVLRADWAPGHDLTTKEGRLAAIAESGKRGIILDFVSNYTRHGLPDDDYEWTLDVPKRKEKEESQYKRCPDCQRPVIKFDMVCPHCGHVFEKRVVIRKGIEEQEGQLVNIKETNRADMNRLVLAIARGARKLEKAYAIGQEMGADRALVDTVWRKYLRNA